MRLLDKWKLARRHPFYQSVLYHLDYASRVARDLRADPCDVVHVHNFPQCARVMRWFNPKIRIVLHMHCDWLTQLDPASVRARLKETDMVLGVSDYITDRARGGFSAGGTQFHTLHNAADLARFGAPRARAVGEGCRILFVGRISPEKGIHRLLEAFVRVCELIPDATLDLAGPENVLSREFLDPMRTNVVLERIDHFFRDRASYAPYLKSHLPPHVAGRVRFLGGMKQEDLAAHYAAADLFVLPSIFDEPFGMPLAEAMAAGLPCIATRAGAFPEIVSDGETGWLVERDDAAALADAMVRSLGNPAEARAMGEAGKQRATEYFDWDRIAEELVDDYELMFQGGRGVSRMNQMQCLSR